MSESLASNNSSQKKLDTRGRVTHNPSDFQRNLQLPLRLSRNWFLSKRLSQSNLLLGERRRQPN